LPRTPLRVNLIGLGVVLTLNTLNAFVLGLGHAGMALATSCMALINCGQLSHALSRQVTFGPAGEWAGFVGRVLAAALACGAVAWGLNALVEAHTASRLLRGVGLVGAIAASMLVYAAVAFALRVRETS